VLYGRAMLARHGSSQTLVTAPRQSLLQDKLQTTRQQYVVGREYEKSFFRKALENPEAAVIHLYGPGGIGKTTLLNEFVNLCFEHEALAIRLDARTIEPRAESFLRALKQSLGLESSAAPLEVLAAQSRRCVLLLDTYELLTSLDDWLRETFLPQLPFNMLVVMAGRNAPSISWRSDPSWRGLVQTMGLRNFQPEESYEFLSRRGISSERHDSLLAFTHGHPLALSLIADVLEQDSSLTFTSEQFPNVVNTLVECFIAHVPSAQHRLALETCAHTRVTSEALLRETLEQKDVHEIFEWLRKLSFIEQSSEGLFPHDLARETIDAALRWRDPESYVALHRRVRAHIIRHIQDLQGLEQFRAASDLIYLHRNNPIMKAFFDFGEVGRVHAEKVRAEDHAAIIAMTEKHEGEHSASIVAYWLKRQPRAFWVVRGKTEVLGCFAHLALHDVTLEDRAIDPVVNAAWDYLARHAPLRLGETALCNRFMIDEATYQEPSPVINALQAAHLCDWLTTPRLAWSMIRASPNMESLLRYIDYQQLPLDVTTSVAPQLSFGHDWRVRQLEAWLELMGGREITTKMNEHDLEPPPSTIIVLSQSEFAEAVKSALREYHQATALEKNPLLHSRLIKGACTIKALRDLLRQAAESLRAKPKDEKFYRALNATYLEPAATRELAAERLGLPFETYRYHLSKGTERITEYLWELELQAH
jgi:hypothetical protein